MSEDSIIKDSDFPVTKSRLIEDLHSGGLRSGEKIIVHSSLSSLGWVCGGPITLIQAFMDIVTEKGNIVMPAHSEDYTEPSYWKNPPVDEAWWDTIRKEMPAYQPEITPCGSIGVVPETFRKFPGVKRSSHPAVSFTAWGQDSNYIISNHSLENSLGQNSPLGKIYDLKGKILLIGVNHDRNTSLHLAEHKANFQKEKELQGSPIIRDQKRVWVEYEDLKYDDSDFIDVGEAFENKNNYQEFNIGHTTARLLPQKALVDYAAKWFSKNRK
ncbi:AAC(3) family N-acetyltransferase [Halanaerobiaceae bacterium Z-7014]|uniref:Aminoglycoside N(3)-acetyltransferase n=1 Tax=Halonatronomonas betaini TaxID=2778430 RepID=A0A931F7H9_9FIRM|nr:AAC(3) family N-acetyltransferase [Halonatronomonas betaini]MBF8437950.1 AAC(3) family N-acetyltransferase [Halonatronomonas betaini]